MVTLYMGCDVSSVSPSNSLFFQSDDENADNITVSPGPESKRLKTEPAERNPTPPPPPSARSPPLLIPSPLASAASSPPATATAATTGDPFRCDPCDIGFSHLSNFVAHKKYYCRGGKVGGEGDKASEAAAANGTLVSPKTEK